jgi:DNA modification methylase
MTETRKVDEIIWREDLYPRFNPIPAKVQEYAENVELLPPIEVNQHNELINGYHRWTAQRKEEIKQIAVIVTTTKSDANLLALAYERNAHGTVAITPEERKQGALRMYADGTGRTEEEIAKLLHVTPQTIKRYLARTKRDNKKARDRKIAEMWLACHTEEETAKAVSVDQKTVNNLMAELGKVDTWQKFLIFSEYQDPDWSPPIYNVWKQQNKSNKTSHFGNSEALFTDYLLYLYTEPYDIVVDPFAGGGSTIDVCKHRLRRYWVSDRLPIVERLDIRQHDILGGPPPLHKRWGDASLLFLDPPYWKQAEGEYGDDPQNLANMELETFHKTMIDFIAACSEKMRAGAHIAMLMQPTQWRAPDRHFAEDHAFEIRAGLQGAPLRFVKTIQAPYESQQYNAQQVNWAKENKEVLGLDRTITIWQVTK